MGEDLVHGSDVPKTDSDPDMAWTENDKDREDVKQAPESVEPGPDRGGAAGPAEASGSRLTREDIEAAVTHGEIVLVARGDGGAGGE